MPDDSFGDLERALLQSARSDGPSAEETQRAWHRFGAAMGGAASMTGATAGATAGKVAAFGSARFAAVCTIAGLVAGGLVTSAWLGAHARIGIAPRVVVIESSAPPSVVASPPPVIAPTAPSSAVATVASAPALAPRPALSANAAPNAAPGIALVDAPSSVAIQPKPSSLALETIALEAAMSALTEGKPEDALRRVADYRAQFPEGVLARDVDVVAIEAFVALGERASFERAAYAFLAAFPDDAHAAHVRALVSP